MIKKLSLNNSRAYTLKLIELVKAGFEIDMTQTGTFYGRIYTIAYEDGVEAVDDGEAIVESAPEPEAQEEADEAKKPVGRGRKAK